MTNTDTADAESTAAQVVALAGAGSQLVRVTVNNEEAAAAVPEIVRRAAEVGVGLRSASAYYRSPPAHPTFLLGFAGLPADEIADAIALLAAALGR